MKELLAKRITGLKLAGGRLNGTAQILPFPSATDLRAGRRSELRVEGKSDAGRFEQNVFKYYFRDFGRKERRWEEAAFALLWASGWLALLLATWQPTLSLSGNGG